MEQEKSLRARDDSSAVRRREKRVGPALTSIFLQDQMKLVIIANLQ